MDNVTTTAPAAPDRLPSRELNFVFAGRTGEYFKIWIVNVCLTVLTLGIYSAWAKVRTRRYFYRNVILDGHSFDYHAAPSTILKGRLIAAVVIGSVYATYWFNHIAGFALFGMLFLLSPWVINQASRFNARMTSYRNVRFGFEGNYWQAFVALCLWPVLGVLTAGVLWPLASRQRSAYLMKNYRYGNTPFTGKPTAESFYDIYLAGFGLAMFALLAIAIGIGLVARLWGMLHSLAIPTSSYSAGKMMSVATIMYVCFIMLVWFVTAFIRAKVENAIFSSLRLNHDRFRADLSGWRFGWLVLSNLLVMVVTLGLMFPWAEIRRARYVASRIVMDAVSNLSDFASAATTDGSVTASELAFLEGLAVGIGT